MINLESLYVLARTEAKLYRQTYGALILVCAKIVAVEAPDFPNHQARLAFVRQFRETFGAFQNFALWLCLAMALNETLAALMPDNVPDAMVLAAVESQFDLLVSFAQSQTEG